jgi:hypothetical protein
MPGPASFAWPLMNFTDEIWTASDPIRFAGTWFPHVMTVIRLGDGSLLIHSPCRFSQALAESIRALGSVRHVVAPNWFHDLYLAEYRAAFPDATFWGPRFLQRLKGTRLIDAALNQSSLPWAREMSTAAVPGWLTFDEHVFFHNSTRTLIVADLLMNVCAAEDVPPYTRLAYALTGTKGRLSVFPLLRLAIPDYASLRNAARQMLDWQPRRIIVGHGASIATDASEQLQQALGWLVRSSR